MTFLMVAALACAGVVGYSLPVPRRRGGREPQPVWSLYSGD